LLSDVFEFLLKLFEADLEIVQLRFSRLCLGRPERPDEGDQIAHLLAGNLVPERRHPDPLTVQYAHDQLGVIPAHLPRTLGKVRDHGQAVPHVGPRAVGTVAPRTKSLKEPAPFSIARTLMG
jgi:hypothetical protein